MRGFWKKKSSRGKIVLRLFRFERKGGKKWRPETREELSASIFLHLHSQSHSKSKIFIPTINKFQIRGMVIFTIQDIGDERWRKDTVRGEERADSGAQRELLFRGFDPSVNFQGREMKRPMERNRWREPSTLKVRLNYFRRISYRTSLSDPRMMINIFLTFLFAIRVAE